MARTRTYGKKTQETVERALRAFKRGTLRSGRGGKVTSREQAIAIGLSEARKKGYKVPAARHHARMRKQPHVAYWIRSRGGPRSEWDVVPVYVLGTTTRTDEGIVGHDLRVRPVRLGRGSYTMVVSPDDVEDTP